MSSTSQIDTLFSGISNTSSYPPHNGLAVGPSYIVMAEGSRIEWTNLTGGAATIQSVYSFFGSLGATATSSLYDPRCIYDSASGRFIIIMENIGSNGAVSNIDIAVSKGTNPNDGWYFASLNTSLTVNGQLTSSDRPSISVDGDNIYITAPQYNVNVPGYAGTETWVIGKTVGAGGGLYNGGTMTVVANQITSANQGIFAVAAGNNGKTYYACDYSTGSQIVAVVQVYDTATGTFGPATTISLGNIDQGGAYTAQQQGTTLLLDAGDKRIQNLQYVNGFLWGVCELKPIGSSVPLVHWFKIDVSNPSNPILVAQGDISGASLGTNVATFNSSLAVDAAGDVVINFTASGPNMYPSDYYVYQAATDPTFSAPILYQASTGFFDSGNGSSVQRWGAYSTAIPDPNNPNAVWISNEYVANGWWQTAISQIEINSASVPTIASIETSFSGISDTSGILPHNALAVGPNYIVTLESSRIQWTDLTGGAQTLQSVYQFFKPLGTMATNALFDPRVVYDNVNNRYIVTMDNIGSGGAISNIDIAVSKDSNPNDGWYFASLNTSLTINGQLTSSDTPVVSVDGSNIYITAPQYNVNASGWQGTAVWVIGDTIGAGGGIYNGGTMTVVASEIMPSSQGIYRVVAGNNGKTYFASSYSTGSQIVVSLKIYDVATGTFGPTNVIGLGKIDQGGSYTAQQLGTNLLLDATDKRIQNLAYANGFLYGVMEEKPIGSSVPLVHWFKIDVSNPNAPALVAQGDISGASIGTNVATFNASIAANDAGDVIINFTASGPNMYPSAYYVFRSVSDASGSFSAPALYQPSTSFFDSGNGSSVQRWGINSTAIVDPNNPHSFWISNEYVANGWWQTAVSQVQLQTAPEASALTLGTTALTVNAEGSVAPPISVTPFDADDTVSVTNSGPTSYDSGGSDHPVNSLTITASNTTAGEMATSAPQTIVITDPPAVSATAAGTAPADHSWGTNSHGAALDRLTALMDQYMAAGLNGSSNTNFGQIVEKLSAHAGFEDLPFLSASHHHHHA